MKKAPQLVWSPFGHLACLLCLAMSARITKASSKLTAGSNIIIIAFSTILSCSSVQYASDDNDGKLTRLSAFCSWGM